MEYTLKYLTVDSLVKLVLQCGKGCLIFKRDLKKAYRQMFIDPGDCHLLGFEFEGKLYFDTTLTMGMRSNLPVQYGCHSAYLQNKGIQRCKLFRRLGTSPNGK